ncbi:MULTISPECIES: Wadjet anti-phage system protein JetD domain-containing protein [unclassified Bradyrhizobium]|uniref:Wadjet anti-phage system protein JetD domain-containing protein n=1 Tax=unclassified Bradyrhizobium TaxID=2631580 RepID=UPI003D211683
MLTIENYASFNRQVREIESDGLIVCLGGFPAAGVIALLDRVLAGIQGTVPFLHWGDIDSGELRIFRLLEEVLPRRPTPHLMTQQLAESAG